jgi:hypothetical protein
MAERRALDPKVLGSSPSSPASLDKEGRVEVQEF